MIWRIEDEYILDFICLIRRIFDIQATNHTNVLFPSGNLAAIVNKTDPTISTKAMRVVKFTIGQMDILIIFEMPC